ncbi:hypothetical protein [Aquimarina sp. 2201CG5-10]|uniref:hypothetical protein n=1 Tax=Aquimarina callyspongiae TaxID=3098150 RepID=UPI002AB3C21E|nr:hypothetical protein [Aquimarina sp. 2201CG5-10]MDY8135705.1 hypothetical protein [Aquimarina sp. 2201CG5-10]
MIKTFFRNLAEKENGKIYYQDEDISIGDGVRSPNVIFIVKFTYKENQITILNRTGTAYVGEITCTLPSTSRPIQFELSSISHLTNFFLRKKSRLKITSENENIKHFFKNNSALNKLKEIAKKEDFSPLIYCDPSEERKIIAKYHLEFSDWTEVIEPIIELYKNLADEFENRTLSYYRSQ